MFYTAKGGSEKLTLLIFQGGPFEILKTIRIIIRNTTSQKQLTPLIPEITRKYPAVMDLLSIERPYELPRETFGVEVLHNATGRKVYKCPSCKNISGFAAPENPEDISLFSHNYNCPNKYKIPEEI